MALVVFGTLVARGHSQVLFALHNGIESIRITEMTLTQTVAPASTVVYTTHRLVRVAQRKT
jgi:hypothetical protein